MATGHPHVGYRPRRTRRGHFFIFTVLFVISLAAPTIWSAQASLAAARPPRTVVEVRAFNPAEFGLDRPVGIAYDPTSGSLLIAGIGDSATTPLLAILPDQSLIGSYSVSGIDDPSSITFDPTSARLVGTKGGELVGVDAALLGGGSTASATGRHVGEAIGVSVDPATGDLYVLAPRASSVLRVGTGGDVGELRLRGLPKAKLGAIAFNPEDGRIHVASADGSALFAIGADGTVEVSYDLSPLAIADLHSIVFEIGRAHV